jgi:magnesium-transporting ATPase (P-type)
LQRNEIIAEGGKDHAGAHEVSSPVMLSGSRVLNGEGKMIIIAVGKLSAMGKIQNLLSNAEEVATPL